MNKEYTIETVTRFRTIDGEEHSSLSCAEDYNNKLRFKDTANSALHSGASIADCLLATGYSGELDPILHRITKDTKLVIEYWQGQRKAGYSPIRFNTNHSIFVHGDAGAWSGAYGGDMSLSDLARYAKHPNTTGLLPSATDQD